MTEQEKKMNKIEYALKLAKDCTYADEMTEGAKEHLRNEIDLALIELSDRDQFAIGFAEWKEDNFKYSYNNPLCGMVYVNIHTRKEHANSELLDLYKKSLKTDKA